MDKIHRIYRKHPRVYEKQLEKEAENQEDIINISGTLAVGILITVFLKGMFWGYILKRS